MRGGIVAALALAAASAAAPAQERGQAVREALGPEASIPAYHALVIGINDYQHWQDLRRARADAEALAGLLRSAYGFREVRTLFDGQATRAAILKQLYDLAQALGPADSLLVYYAGHGFFDRTLDNGYWVPAEGAEPAGGQPDLAGWIQDTTLKDLLAKTKARHVLVLSDACFSGALLRGGPVDLSAKENAYYRTAIGQPTRWCITSGDLEAVPDESVFSQKILQVLQYPKRKVFAGSDIANWIKADVAEFTGKQPRFGPMKTASSSESGEFVFLWYGPAEGLAVPPPEPRPSSGPVAVPLTGTLVVKSPEAGTVSVDGGAGAAIGPSAAQRWDRLPVGPHRVRVSAGGKTWEQTVTVVEDQTVAASAVFGAQPGEPLTVDLGGGVKMEFVWIEPGTFTMGSPAGEAGRYDDEAQHEVRLTKGFWMGKTEVTQAQWERVMGNNPSRFTNAGSDAPVENVSWDDCQEFVRKFNGLRPRTDSGEPITGIRLPTEAEWEYACRAGTTGRFYTGDRDADLGRAGWYGENSGSTTHPVGQKQKNAFGLYDMHGNVWEWCQDWFGAYPTGTVTDPTGPSSGSARVLRGGSWFLNARCCRSAFRFRFVPAYRINLCGFPVVGFR